MIKSSKLKPNNVLGELLSSPLLFDALKEV